MKFDETTESELQNEKKSLEENRAPSPDCCAEELELLPPNDANYPYGAESIASWIKLAEDMTVAQYDLRDDQEPRQVTPKEKGSLTVIGSGIETSMFYPR